MHVIIFILTLFLAPTPTQPNVQVQTVSKVMPDADTCKGLAEIITAQARQDPKVLDVATGCFEIVGDVGKKA
jgi:hypothetical protein